MQLKNDHTPGPWTPGNYDTTETMIERLREGSQAAVVQYLGAPIGNFGDSGSGLLVALTGPFEDPQSRADALLMAKAPELLTALFSILVRIREDGFYPVFQPEVQIALEALAPFLDPASVKGLNFYRPPASPEPAPESAEAALERWENFPFRKPDRPSGPYLGADEPAE